MKKDKLKNQKFFNRELSWLEFNKRVLEEAQDPSNPLFERLKFSSIVSANLDEFFMVRVGGLYDMLCANFNDEGNSHTRIKGLIELINEKVQEMVYSQYNCLNRSLLKNLKKEKIFFLNKEDLATEEEDYVNSFFEDNIFPVLTPMVVDASRPFPLIQNKSLNIAMLVKNKKDGNGKLAIVQVPSVIERFIEIPSNNEKRYLILLEEIIKLNIKKIFFECDIQNMSCFRITRSADLDFSEEDTEDLLEEIKQSIKKRKRGEIVRLEVETGIKSELLQILKEKFEISKKFIYRISGPLDLTFLSKLYSLEGYENIKFKQFFPTTLNETFYGDIFELISKKDILLHCPFDSFQLIINLIHAASQDPNVLAIKQTLYRVSGRSPIIDALILAAESGKQVTVLVELKARFDEENNIHWAGRLEKAGCHVIYGVVGLKTHCKLLLIVRREAEGIKRYVHMSTGNYNDDTAKYYTDISLFTCNSYFGVDASNIFNMLSALTNKTELNKVAIAPINLREKFIELIENEIKQVKKGNKGRIIAKMNSLVDEEIIENLYEASNEGVKIDLIVRGICCLVPGVVNLSENISVRSVVGRFLEHSRIFYFYNNGNDLIYLSSADWMSRNLDRRVEVLFPIEDDDNKDKLLKVLSLYLKDTVKARILNSNGSYSRVDKRGKESINTQEYLILSNRFKEVAISIIDEPVFKPILRENG